MILLTAKENGSFGIANDIYQVGDIAQINYNSNTGKVAIQPKYLHRHYEGHYTDFGAAEGVPFVSLEALLQFCKDNFFFYR